MAPSPAYFRDSTSTEMKSCALTWINIGTRDAAPFSLFRLDAGGLKRRHPDRLLHLEPVGQLLRPLEQMGKR